MKVLITGAAGNLGGFLAFYLLRESDHFLNLMVHKTPVKKPLETSRRTKVYQCDLDNPESLNEACANSDVIIHFAGVLFAPKPKYYLPRTNTIYTQNLIDAAILNGVKKFILVSFPHVEGPTSQKDPCTDRQDREPISIHAKTRLAAEQDLFERAQDTQMTPISLRPGMIYGKDILMLSFAKKLAKKKLLAVWRKPLPIHVLSINDFNACCKAAIEKQDIYGIYPLGDDRLITLQEFMDTCCRKWKLPKPRRVPVWSVYFAAWLCETFADQLSTRTPFTVDLIRIGRVPYFCDTSRMKKDLLPVLKFRSLEEGKTIL